MQLLVREIGEVGTAPNERRDAGQRDVSGCGGRVGHHLLGQHIQRIAQVVRRLDLTVDHPANDDRRLQEVAPVLGVDRALRGFAHLVAGATDALQTTTDGPG